MTEPDASNNGMPTPITGSQVPRRAPDRRRRNGGPGHGLGDVDALIAAATDRAHPRELAGEEAAVAAFREMHRRSAGSAPSNRRSVRVPRLVAGSLTAKIALSLGVLSLGGIAFAAETGSLPTSAQSAAHQVFRAVGVPDADQRASEHASDNGGQPTQTHSGGQQAGAASPAITGLCRAYASGDKKDHGKALDSTAFQALATAAGGEGKIEAFCAGVLASPSAGPSTIPSSSPSATPGQAQTDPEPTTATPPENDDDQGNPPNPTHPTGPPTDLPTPTNVGKP
jgi:hypothetical protein